MDWFRCYSEFATDPKVQIMPENMQRRLIMVFCLRSSNALATLHETEICFSLRITEQELTETKALFIQKGFINDKWEVQNWDKRQYISDTSTERSRKHREKKKTTKQRTCNVAATPPEQNRTEANTDSKELKSINSLESALPDFKDLIFSEEFLKVAQENGLTPEHGAKSFEIWKIKRKSKPPKDLLGDFWIWCLNEKKPVIQENGTTEKPLEGKELQIHMLGVINWKRRAAKSNASFKPTDEETRQLEAWEAKNGTVNWDNFRQWQRQQGASP